jgi:hypothetical protein
LRHLSLDLFGSDTEALEDAVVITAIKELDIDFRVERPQETELAVLATHKRLPHSRELDIEIVFDQVEVGREHFYGPSVTPLKWEVIGLVEPFDSVIVEETGELGLAGMMEIYTSNADHTAWRARFSTRSGRIVGSLRCGTIGRRMGR